MTERTSGIRSLLSVPALYELLQQVIGSPRVRDEFINRHVRPSDGDRILDIGCGPGNLREYFGDVTYVGLDPSADYIKAANRRFGDRGRFFVAGVDDLDVHDLGEFDIVIAKSVLHHIDDDQARRLFRTAARVLVTGGRLVTLDAAFVEGQSAASRFVVGQDRGANVRSDHHYVELAREFFTDVTATVHHRLLRVPYTHVFLDCASPVTADRTADAASAS